MIALRGLLSPDGRKLIFDLLGFSDFNPTRVAVKRLGTEPLGWDISIASGYKDGDPENEFSQVSNAVFSPDGSEVAFEAYVPFSSGGQSGIFVKNSDGTGEAELAIGGGFEPDWQPLQP